MLFAMVISAASALAGVSDHRADDRAPADPRLELSLNLLGSKAGETDAACHRASSNRPEARSGHGVHIRSASTRSPAPLRSNFRTPQIVVAFNQPAPPKTNPLQAP